MSTITVNISKDTKTGKFVACSACGEITTVGDTRFEALENFKEALNWYIRLVIKERAKRRRWWWPFG